MKKRYASLYDRLVANTELDEETGCWVWTGKSHKGYGTFTARVEGKKSPSTFYAHRSMLEITTGYYFPFDQAGHYKCFNTKCINPDHLRIETVAENLSTRRGYEPCKGRWIPVLFPTPERLAREALDASLSLSMEPISQPIEETDDCPF